MRMRTLGCICLAVGANVVTLHGNGTRSCQIILTKELEGLELTLPSATRNFYVDGHVPEPH
jgi:hypothetical protein